MDNLHLIQLNQYERPTITEERNKDYVSIGDNNDYYQCLIDAFMDSTTNNAVINGIVNQIYGKGLDATDSAEKPDQYAQMKSLVKPHDLRNVCQDLKLLGEGSMQIIYKNGKVYKAEHFPRQTLRAEKCNEKGEIEAYYYHYNWAKISPSDKPKRIPAFGYGNGKESEIKIIKRYVSGFDYYAPVDYQGGLAYAELEEEIADYLINEVQCGFSRTKVVNFNNGVPDREKQMQVKDDVLNKLTGSRGEKVIVAFNNNAESKTTVDDIPLNDAPQHYEYLSNECVKKLIISHRVTSPLLIGVKDGNGGLGNNADEIKTATLLFDNIVIKPYQQLLTDCFDSILSVNNISLNLYFKTIQPLEFTETKDIVNEEQREEETGVKLSSQQETEMFEELEQLGEDENLDEWEIVDERPVDYDQEEALDKMIGLATTGTARPNAKSDQDGENKEGVQFKVRYQYAPLKVSENSREFCKKMVAAKKIYRKEDIISMGDRAVNKGWGLNGADTYSIWFYKGGGDCHHFWMRKTYKAKSPEVKPDVGNPKAEVSVNQAKKKGFKPEKNDKKVAKRPTDMPNSGFVNKKR